MKQDWIIKKLGEVCIIERGGSPRPIDAFLTDSENGVNWIKIGDAVAGSKYISSTKEKIKPEGVRKSRMVHKGDFILSNSMSFGKPYILGIDGCIHDGWLVLRDVKNLFNKSYLYYYLSSPNIYREFKRLAVGGVVNNLNSELVRGVNVVIPPLPEQEKIVAELDCLSGVIEKKRQQLKELDALAQSIFYEMFGDPVINEKGWEVKKLKNIFSVKIGPFGSLLHNSDYVSGGTPLVNPIHMQNETICPDDDFTVSEEKIGELQNYRLYTGDIIFARRGDIGRCALVKEKDNGFLCGTGSLFVRPVQPINSLYFVKLMRCESMIRHLTSFAKGATMLNINCKIIEDLDIILPPLPLQQTFASKIEAIEKQKALIKQSLGEVETLFNARMQEYFD